MIPALANYFIAMFKETPRLSAITVLELKNQAKSIANSNYRYIEPITLVGVLFLVISLISVVGIRWMEERYAGHDGCIGRRVGYVPGFRPATRWVKGRVVHELLC